MRKNLAASYCELRIRGTGAWQRRGRSAIFRRMSFSLKPRTFALALAASVVVTPAGAQEIPRGIAFLYESVSIYPPNGNSMTICYGFVCRRRIEFEFTAADKKA